VYDDVTYVYDDVTYVSDDVTYCSGASKARSREQHQRLYSAH